MELLTMKLVCDMYDKRTYTVAENEKKQLYDQKYDYSITA